MPIPSTHPPLPLPPRPTLGQRRAAQRSSGDRHRPSHRTASNHGTTFNRQQAYLRTLGAQLRVRRQKCRFSFVQLHHLTKIPLQHLQAMESGQLSALPTNPNYLWGTVRIWGKVLGLDGLKLAAGIPDFPVTSELPMTSLPPTSAQPVMADRKQTDKRARTKTTQIPSYLTYGTLAAGTLLGAGWFVEQNAAPSLPLDEPASVPTASERQHNLEVQRSILPSDVAPPEGMRRHLRRN